MLVTVFLFNFYFWPVVGLGCGACGLLIALVSLVGEHLQDLTSSTRV